MKAKTLDKWMKYTLPVVMVVLIVYLYIAFFTSIKHTGVLFLEIGILGYFGAELAVKWRLSDNWRDFLRNHWLKIVLLLPFLRIFRIFSVVGIVSRSGMTSLRMLPYMQKLVKLPTLLKKSKPIFLAVMGYLSIREAKREEAD